MLNQIVTWLAWLLIPVAAITLVDDWFLRPRRRLAALPAIAEDPPFLRAAYAALPVLAIAGAIKLLRSERLDFSLVLVLVTVVGGVIWALDALVLAPARARAAVARGRRLRLCRSRASSTTRAAWCRWCWWCCCCARSCSSRSAFPSDSMMPTLQDGDFILVNKFRYGLRLPVTNTKILSLGEPQRGDVVVFRYPPDPAVNYIKRLVGLPGDRVRMVVGPDLRQRRAAGRAGASVAIRTAATRTCACRRCTPASMCTTCFPAGPRMASLVRRLPALQPAPGPGLQLRGGGSAVSAAPGIRRCA